MMLTNKPLFISNTLTRKKEEFKPHNPPFVGLYVCGPTVYNDVHLGNVRTFITFDMVYRYLKFLGYKVRYVRNITDVGHITAEFDDGVDRIGNQARLEQLEPMEIVQKYTNGFHYVMNLFNCIPPSIEPTATAHIVEQIEMTQKIIANGFAYESNGSVYFDVRKYSEKYNYGKLSGRNVEELFENTRDLDGQEEKKFFADFALWKKADPSHIMQWSSPWGKGFPGWHIECSVMSTKYLGKTFDIHGGGMDLKFPHHECEIAQSVGCDGEEPVRYWMHGNMLTVNGAKMSKSLGNSILPEQLVTGEHPLLEKGYSPMALRFFMFQTHYSSTLDITNEALKGAEKAFQRLTAAMTLVSKLKASESSSFNVTEWREKCFEAMNDDFNAPILVAHLFEAVRIINSVNDGKESLTSTDIKLMDETLKGFVNEVLGVSTEETQTSNTDLLNYLMQEMLNRRAEAKKNKDFAMSDAIRDELLKRNVVIKDTKDGATWEVM